MRVISSVLLVLAVTASTARADRSTVLTVAAMTDVRVGEMQGPTGLGGGARVTISFEHHPLYPAMPGTGSLRLVPELLAGTLALGDLVEGYAGAGVRGELDLATATLRPTLYLAARAIAVGRDVNGEGEIAFGQAFILHGWTRLGWEAAIDARPANRDGQRQIDMLATLYYGWRL